MGAQRLLHRELCVTGPAQGFEGQEEAWDQIQGGASQLQRMHFSDLVPYQCRRELNLLFLRSSQCLLYSILPARILGLNRD
jgi:hypothetical protein